VLFSNGAGASIDFSSIGSIASPLSTVFSTFPPPHTLCRSPVDVDTGGRLQFRFRRWVCPRGTRVNARHLLTLSLALRASPANRASSKQVELVLQASSFGHCFTLASASWSATRCQPLERHREFCTADRNIINPLPNLGTPIWVNCHFG
jgi:hypothetical protein